jgi:starch synthase
MNDPFLPVNYSSDDLSGKRICKRAIQDRLGLLHMDAPLLGMVSRLYWQKGVDLLVEALKLTAKLDYQVAILGTGDPGIEASLQALAKEFPGRVALDLRYDPTLAHIIQAGSDFMLLPSRYEPCGLGQMYALAYGTVPIVRRTGGLADSVHDAHPVYAKRDESNGLSFVPKTKGALARAIERATLLYADKPAYIALQLRGMGQDFSWETSSARYEALFADALTAANATGELAHAG